jgi:hypothetical protein
MMMLRTVRTALVAAGVAFAMPAGGATVVLDGQGITWDSGALYFPAQKVIEDGFSYWTSAMFLRGMGVTLEDDFGPIVSDVRSERGVPFHVLSATVQAATQAWISGPPPRPDEYDEWVFAEKLFWDNLQFTGYREGEPVASKLMSVGGATRSFTDPIEVAFDASFRDLDVLSIEYILPANYVLGFSSGGPNIPPGTVWCAEWCGTINVSRLEVAPIPVPPAAGLLLGAVGALALAGWRGRRGGGVAGSGGSARPG